MKALSLSLMLVLAAPSAGAGKDLVRWRTLEAGQKEARSSGKPVLYLFTADWCRPCHVLKAEVFSVKELADLVEKRFVPIEVSDRYREEGRNPPGVDALQEQYQVQGFPTLVATRLDTKKAVYVAGYPGKDTVEAFLRGVESELGPPARRKKGVKKT